MQEQLAEAQTARASIEAEVKKALDAKNDIEKRLAAEVEARRVIEARLIETDQAHSSDLTTIKGLESALKASEERLKKEQETRLALETEIRRISREAEAVRKEGIDYAGLLTIKEQFASLMQEIAEKLKAGEVSPDDIVKFMKIDDMVGFYVVKQGDTLWRIASRKGAYANPYMWPLIYRYNVAKLKGPDIIRVGQVLVIFNT